MHFAKKDLTYIKFKEEDKYLIISPSVAIDILPIILDGQGLNENDIKYVKQYEEGDVYTEKHTPEHWID